MRIGLCPSCNLLGVLTRHHVKPVRHFGRGKRNNHVVYLCRKCHNTLESLIPYQKMPVSFYYQILPFFGILI